MSQVARCELVLEPYPEEGAELGPDGSGAQYLLGGWTSHPQQPGIQLVEPFGSLGFELPEGWEASDLSVHLQGVGAGTPELSVNNEPVSVAPDGDGWVAEVPADIVGQMGEGRLVVTVAPAAAGGALSLTHVSLEPL